MPISELNSLFEENKNQILADYFTFLKFKTISAQPEFKDEMQKCAAWLVSYFQNVGFHAEKIETTSNPLVFSEWNKAGTDKPTLLIYGHYDVQPVDPIELWNSPPFEPTVKDNIVYARGAQDNKGQIFFVISSIATLLKQNGTLPINIKFIIEGDEECGGEGLEHSLEKIAGKIKADYLTIVDVGLKSATQPSVTIGTRGIMTMTVTLSEGNTDLHSGTFGNVAYNPNRALAEIIASFYDKDGRVQIQGFYDDVVMPTSEELKMLDVAVDTEYFKKEFNLACTGGEQNLELGTRRFFRPSLEINGINGGYSGDGFKTVIPQKALAKISVRLVPKQDGKKIAELISNHIKNHLPVGLTSKIEIHESNNVAFRSSPNSKICSACIEAFSEVNDTKCVVVIDPASIPIAPKLSETANAETVLIGYGLDSDAIHAPNEHFGLDRFKKGFVTIGRIIEKLYS